MQEMSLLQGGMQDVKHGEGRTTGTLAIWEVPPGVLSTLKLFPGESERRNGLLESQCVPEHMDSPRMVVLKA